MGIKRGERVAWLGYNSHELLEAYYGVVQMGAVLLPLNIRLTPAEIAFILNDSDSVAVFYNRDLQPIIDGIRNQAPAVRHYVPLESNGDGKDYEALISAAGADFTPPDIKDDDLAELFYTSGTTANPEGRDDDPSQSLPACFAGDRRASVSMTRSFSFTPFRCFTSTAGARRTRSRAWARVTSSSRSSIQPRCSS